VRFFGITIAIAILGILRRLMLRRGSTPPMAVPPRGGAIPLLVLGLVVVTSFLLK